MSRFRELGGWRPQDAEPSPEAEGRVVGTSDSLLQTTRPHEKAGRPG